MLALVLDLNPLSFASWLSWAKATIMGCLVLAIMLLIFSQARLLQKMMCCRIRFQIWICVFHELTLVLHLQSRTISNYLGDKDTILLCLLPPHALQFYLYARSSKSYLDLFTS